MQANDKPVLIYSTFPAGESAEVVGTGLVDEGKAACVNIIPGIVSIYRWEGERQRDAEVVMIIKTRRALAAQVTALIRARHPYSNPSIMVLPVEGGSPEFLAWIMGQTGAAG